MPTSAMTTNEASANEAVRRPVIDHCAKPRTLSLGPVFQHVANAAHVVHQFGVEGVVDFCAQAAHRDIDDVGVAVEIHVPNLFGDECSRQHLAGAPHQQREQAEFLGRQIETLTARLAVLEDRLSELLKPGLTKVNEPRAPREKREREAVSEPRPTMPAI